MTTLARRLLPSGHEVAECPHCHSIAGVDVATLTASAPIPGTAIRCNACGTRGPIEPDIRRAVIGWNNLSRLAEIAASLLAMRPPFRCTMDGSNDSIPAHAVSTHRDDVPAKDLAKPAPAPLDPSKIIFGPQPQVFSETPHEIPPVGKEAAAP